MVLASVNNARNMILQITTGKAVSFVISTVLFAPSVIFVLRLKWSKSLSVNSNSFPKKASIFGHIEYDSVLENYSFQNVSWVRFFGVSLLRQ